MPRGRCGRGSPRAEEGDVELDRLYQEIAGTAYGSAIGAVL